MFEGATHVFTEEEVRAMFIKIYLIRLSLLMRLMMLEV